jgi:hypothetical protein
MTKTLLPTITPDQCDETGGQHIGQNHAAHTVYINRPSQWGSRPGAVAIGQCPGRHNYTSPVQPTDPFAGLDD